MNFDVDELDLEYMEPDAEKRLTHQDALLLGLVPDSESRDSDMDARA